MKRLIEKDTYCVDVLNQIASIQIRKCDMLSLKHFALYFFRLVGRLCVSAIQGRLAYR
ncbi:hypothetical protein ICC18_23895 [Paenibacillus sp. WST5]|uniref:Uncharacterized protein n=1 Tax=Paenibacillus sedimenti TaxID=2770274 RepID=A0A926QKT6_9BACL|nr:hypothetical protein [Paenibacillus sedimenti]